MKEIRAYIRVERAAEVQAALSEAGISHMTLSHVLAVGAHNDADQAKANIEFGCYVNRRVKVEIICLDKDEARVVEVVRMAACTGQSGDGIITVVNVNHLIKIRTAAQSAEAL
jgi:nitrogen regulatory protein PII